MDNNGIENQPNLSSFGHTGDVHAPREFGFDMRNDEDRIEWQEITGEIPIIPTDMESTGRATGQIVAIGDFTEAEALIVQDLVNGGTSRKVAVEVVLYERLEAGPESYVSTTPTPLIRPPAVDDMNSGTNPMYTPTTAQRDGIDPSNPGIFSQIGETRGE